MEPSKVPDPSRILVESEIRPEISDRPKKPDKPDNRIKQVFDYWREVLNHPGSMLSPKRERKIRQRLENGFTVDQLMLAIDGCRASPHHQGENDDNKVYDDIELICRDIEHVEMFIGIVQRKEIDSGEDQQIGFAAGSRKRTRQFGQTLDYYGSQLTEFTETERAIAAAAVDSDCDSDAPNVTRITEPARARGRP